MIVPYEMVVTARQWQAAKMRPTQFGDNKNRSSGRIQHEKRNRQLFKEYLEAKFMKDVPVVKEVSNVKEN